MKCFMHVHSNTGLPIAMGRYNKTTADMSANYKASFKNDWLNIVGNCCGSTPAHIKSIGKEAFKYKPC